MLLAGRVLKVEGNKAIVDVNGKTREALLNYIRDVNPGDYVKIYYGIVLEKVSKEEAIETLERCSYIPRQRVEMRFSLEHPP